MAYAVGKTACTTSSTEIIAKDDYRTKLILQLRTGNPVSLGIGATAVDGSGVGLLAVGQSITLEGPEAQVAVNGITNAATGTVGYQTF